MKMGVDGTVLADTVTPELVQQLMAKLELPCELETFYWGKVDIYQLPPVFRVRYLDLSEEVKAILIDKRITEMPLNFLDKGPKWNALHSAVIERYHKYFDAIAENIDKLVPFTDDQNRNAQLLEIMVNFDQYTPVDGTNVTVISKGRL